MEQRHGGEVSRLKDAIATLEKSERTLLKARAVLEARVADLEAALEAAQRQAASEAESVQLAVGAAVASATTQLQQQVGQGCGGAWLGPATAGLRRQCVMLAKAAQHSGRPCSITLCACACLGDCLVPACGR